MKLPPRQSHDVQLELDALWRENVVLRSVLSRRTERDAEIFAESGCGMSEAQASPAPLTSRPLHEVVQVHSQTDRDAIAQLCLQLADVLRCRYAFVGLLQDREGKNVRTLALVKDGALIDNIEYNLEFGPCKNVLVETACYYPKAVRDRFPHDKVLAALEIECYLGAVLRGTDNTTVGLLVALHDRPLKTSFAPKQVISVFGERASALFERIHSEERLRESEERFRLAMDAGRFGTWDVDLESGRLQVSDLVCQMLGVPPAGFGGTLASFLERIHPDDRPMLEQRFAECTAGAVEDFHSEFRALHPTSGSRWLEGRALVKPDRAGEPARILGTLTDVTDRREWIRELLLHRFAIEHAGEAMLRIAPDGRILDANETACQRLDYSRADLQRLRLQDLEPSLTEESWRERWASVRNSRHLMFESSHRTSNGRELPVEVSLSYLEFEGEEFCSAFVRDCTERKRLEDQLLHSQKLEAIGRLAGGVAHDFNNLLTVVLGNLELVEQAIHPGTTAAECVRSAVQASRNAAQLTTRLLTFARRQVGVPRVLDLNQSLRHLVEILQRLVGERIRITTDLAADLPPVRFDEGQLQQVMINLAVNARDAMPDGGVLTIRTRAVDQGRGPLVHLELSDTGHGIPPAAKAHLFEPFFTTKEPGQGTGLGLAMCHGIVATHGGRIWAESTVDEGATFHIELPATAGAEPASDSAEVQRCDRGGDETILLVEDDDSVRQMADRALRSLGYRILVAVDGEEALAIAARHPDRIDLLVTDIVLPRASGREVARTLRSSRPDLKVLFASGYADRLVDGRASAADREILAKPFTPSSLGRRVREILDR